MAKRNFPFKRKTTKFKKQLKSFEERIKELRNINRTKLANKKSNIS